MEFACELCGSAADVRRKLISFDFAVAMPAQPTAHKRVRAGKTRGTFVMGCYCDRCGVGFVPDSILNELGIKTPIERVRGI